MEVPQSFSMYPVPSEKLICILLMVKIPLKSCKTEPIPCLHSIKGTNEYHPIIPGENSVVGYFVKLLNCILPVTVMDWAERKVLPNINRKINNWRRQKPQW